MPDIEAIFDEATNEIDTVPFSWSFLWTKSIKKIGKYPVVILSNRTK